MNGNLKMAQLNLILEATKLNLEAWVQDTEEEFIAKSLHYVIVNLRISIQGVHEIMRLASKAWNGEISCQGLFLMCKVVRKAISTRVMLIHLSICNVDSCFLCCLYDASVDHLISLCNFSECIWQRSSVDSL